MVDLGTYDLTKGYCDRCGSLSELDEITNGDFVCQECSESEEREVREAYRDASPEALSMDKGYGK